MKIFIGLLLFGTLFQGSLHKPKSINNLDSGFAVIELFTSEGCSSCPPADILLREIDTKYAGKNIVVLAYHVDYWNRLGWKDPFSDARNTERQNYYAGIFGLNSIYTPQAIVNGKKEFVGSDRSQLETAITSSVEKNRKFELTTSIKPNGKITAFVHNADLQPGEMIVMALVQKAAVSQVKRGENAGKNLKHINLVNKFFILTGKENKGEFDGKVTDTSNYFVSALIQNKKTGNILGYRIAAI